MSHTDMWAERIVCACQWVQGNVIGSAQGCLHVSKNSLVWKKKTPLICFQGSQHKIFKIHFQLFMWLLQKTCTMSFPSLLCGWLWMDKYLLVMDQGPFQRIPCSSPPSSLDQILTILNHQEERPCGDWCIDGLVEAFILGPCHQVKVLEPSPACKRWMDSTPSTSWVPAIISISN